MIGDLVTAEGVILFWPISTEQIRYRNAIIMGRTYETYMELALFAFFLMALAVSGDFYRLIDLDKRNIIFARANERGL